MRILTENVASYGSLIDALWILITITVGVCFLIAEAVLIYSAIRYRRKDGKKAAYIRGDTWRQAKWILIPVIIVALLDIYIDARTTPAWKLIKEHLPHADQRVGIMGVQFLWLFTYPGPDGSLGTDDDIALPADLHVPVDANIVFDLTSMDVLHSIWVPQLRLKQDAIPGRTIQGWFNATQTGTYEIACAELCGVSHGLMRGTLHVHTAEEYEQWVQSLYPEPE